MWTNARTTEKSLNNNHSTGSSITPHEISAELAIPFRPRKGIQDIILIIFDVQNGIVQRRKQTTCQVKLRT